MMILRSIRMALGEVRRNKLRSVLTMLGIVIGVAAVIAMVTLGQGATDRVTADIAGMGQNLLIVTPGSEKRGPVNDTAQLFDLADAQALEEVPLLSAVAPNSSKGVLAVNGATNTNTNANGSTNAFFDVRGFKIEHGRYFSDAELAGGTPACILGDTVRKNLFGGANAIDATIRVQNVACRVIGTLTAKGPSTFGQDQDDFLVMPLRTFQRRILGKTDVSVIFVQVAKAEEVNRARRRVEAIMRERRRILQGQRDDFAVRDMKEVIKTVSSVLGILTALLGSIAAVSLVVGGIGIMNIMLVSVTERTREIGIRLAIGARTRDVLRQFLVEAVVLSLLGGTIGVGLGLGGSYLAARGLGLPFRILPNILLLAFAFSAGVGVLFGYLPARKAARMNPIEALRHE
jgi:putative ABC transport system permease protein